MLVTFHHQLGTNWSHPRRGTLNARPASIRWACGHVWEAFSWLLDFLNLGRVPGLYLRACSASQREQACELPPRFPLMVGCNLQVQANKPMLLVMVLIKVTETLPDHMVTVSSPKPLSEGLPKPHKIRTYKRHPFLPGPYPIPLSRCISYFFVFFCLGVPQNPCLCSPGNPLLKGGTEVKHDPLFEGATKPW